MAYETENWPRVRARWYTRTPPGTRRAVRLIVIHDMEAPEGPQTAENVARWFANHPGPRKKGASAHICVDGDSIVQCVGDNDVAWAAPGANHDGIQIEIAGYAHQAAKEWLDPYGLRLLPRAADAVAQYCLKYGIPPRRLSDAQLLAGMRGIVGHDQVSRIYKRSNHTDPGNNFPWSYFLGAVTAAHGERSR